MADAVLIDSRIRGGLWEGVLRSAHPEEAPQVEIVHDDRLVSGATIASLPDQPGNWLLRVPIPAESLSDGVQTFVLRVPNGASLGHFTLRIGKDWGEDLRAEVDLLRAELDLLKRAFRRHVAETGGQG